MNTPNSFGWTLMTTLAGAILGWGIWLAFVQQYADQPPPNWERENSPVPYRESALQGSEQPAEGEWGLDFYRAIYPTYTINSERSLAFTATIPKEGMLEAWFSAPPIRKRMGDRWMDICTMRAPRGRTPDPRCIGQSEIGVALILSRLSGQSSLSVLKEDSSGRTIIDCLPMFKNDLSLEGDISVVLNTKGNQLLLTVEDKSYTCVTTVGDRIPMLRSGLRQIKIKELSYGGVQASSLSAQLKWMWILGSAFGITLLGWVERFHGSRSRSIVLTCIPLLLGYWIQQWDTKILIEDLRASWLSSYWVPTILTVVPTVLLKTLTATWRETHRNRNPRVAITIGILTLAIGNVLVYSQGWLSLLLCIVVQGLAVLLCRWWKQSSSAHLPLLWGTFGGLSMMFVEAFHWAGTFWGTVGGTAFGLLMLANRFVVPRFNLWSLSLLSVSLVAAEISLRATKAGLQWSNKGSNTEHNEIFGWVRQANESFALFEEGKHTQYPDKGFPVAITSQNHKMRIISFGGSTTGGAFQNDNLDEFYPALIERALQNSPQAFEVLNQGVGGWTTWHIEAYAEQKSSVLNPDVLTLYVGHNDILTSVPLPYKELYPLWQKQSSSTWSQQLSSIRLYQALKYFLVSMRGADNKVAVPVEHAKANLESIIQRFPNTPIVLGSEGLSPDPGILFAYNQMMKDLASSYDSVYYVPTAEALSMKPPHEVFLDDCHLTTFGHQIVAKMFADTIKEVSTKQ